MTRNADILDGVSLIHTAVCTMEGLHNAGATAIGHGGYEARANVHRVYVDFAMKGGAPAFDLGAILARIVAQIPEGAELSPGATIPIATRDALALKELVE